MSCLSALSTGRRLTELVTTLETVFDHYFYRQVELLIASPGGDTRALAYYLDAVGNWSRKGLRFRTRVVSTAASAGAFMVSLGDERVAEPGARLIYHHARVCNASDLTASAITELHSVLRRLDDAMIGILAVRALKRFHRRPEGPPQVRALGPRGSRAPPCGPPAWQGEDEVKAPAAGSRHRTRSGACLPGP